MRRRRTARCPRPRESASHPAPRPCGPAGRRRRDILMFSGLPATFPCPPRTDAGRGDDPPNPPRGPASRRTPRRRPSSRRSRLGWPTVLLQHPSSARSRLHHLAFSALTFSPRAPARCRVGTRRKSRLRPALQRPLATDSSAPQLLARLRLRLPARLASAGPHAPPPAAPVSPHVPTAARFWLPRIPGLPAPRPHIRHSGAALAPARPTSRRAPSSPSLEPQRSHPQQSRGALSPRLQPEPRARGCFALSGAKSANSADNAPAKREMPNAWVA
jgi:hypothetical protein